MTTYAAVRKSLAEITTNPQITSNTLLVAEERHVYIDGHTDECDPWKWCELSRAKRKLLLDKIILGTEKNNNPPVCSDERFVNEQPLKTKESRRKKLMATVERLKTRIADVGTEIKNTRIKRVELEEIFIRQKSLSARLDDIGDRIKKCASSSETEDLVGTSSCQTERVKNAADCVTRIAMDQQTIRAKLKSIEEDSAIIETLI